MKLHPAAVCTLAWGFLVTLQLAESGISLLSPVEANYFKPQVGDIPIGKMTGLGDWKPSDFRPPDSSLPDGGPNAPGWCAGVDCSFKPLITVCGSNGQTYSHRCWLEEDACINAPSLFLLHEGRCRMGQVRHPHCLDPMNGCHPFGK